MPATRYPAGPGPLEVMWKLNRGGLLRGTAAFFLETARDYGPLTHWTAYGLHVYLVDDPALIEDVLVHKTQHFTKGRAADVLRPMLGSGLLTSEEPEHMRQRRLAQPAFHRDRVRTYATQMLELSDRAVSTWSDGSTIDVGAEMMQLTLTIAARTLFGTQVDSDISTVANAIEATLRFAPFALSPLGPLIARMPWLPLNRRYESARIELDRVIYRIIAERKATGDRGDLLSMLLFAGENGERMTDTLVRDETITAFMAGHETTAVALTWALGLLGKSSSARAQLGAEIDRVVGDRLPMESDVPELPYTRAVFAEAMRLYPPVWAIGRRAKTPLELGGYAIDAGAIVVVSPYVTQRSARTFTEPLEFRPERWHESHAALPKFAYFPFSAGSRMCIGESFAWTEGILALATIAQRYELLPCTSTLPDFSTVITLRPRTPLRMRLRARQRTR